MWTRKGCLHIRIRLGREGVGESCFGEDRCTRLSLRNLIKQSQFGGRQLDGGFHVDLFLSFQLKMSVRTRGICRIPQPIWYTSDTIGLRYPIRPRFGHYHGRVRVSTSHKADHSKKVACASWVEVEIFG